MDAMVKKENDKVSVTIDQRVVDQIIKLGSKVQFYPSTTDGGFLVEDKIIPEFTGQIIGLEVEGVKFENKICHTVPLPENGQLPEGYARRCRVKMKVNEQLIEIKVSKWSLDKRLSKYLEALRRQKVNPSEVITRISTSRETNKYGTFTALKFEAVGMIGQPETASKSSDEQSLSAEPNQNQKNPWA